MSITTLFSRTEGNRGRFLALPAVLVLSLLSFWASPARAQGPEAGVDLDRARRAMVERDLRGRGIRDPAVLRAMAEVPRHLFVPEGLRALAYEDRALPIGEDQTISQPYIVALMTELLELQGTERVLEVGTGSGYQAAVLSLLAKQVYTIEIIPSLAKQAREKLERLGYDNVQVRSGDGFFGWEANAPFDAILVTAAAQDIPEPLWRQLGSGGRLIMPLEKTRSSQKLVRVRKADRRRAVEEITDVIFVPMTGAIQRSDR